MADKKAVASGNWSDTATWDGGTLPGAADDVYANGFTVTVDIDRIAGSVRNGSGAGIVAGGTFVLADGVTLTANVVGGNSTTAVLQFTAAAPASSAIVGNITGSTVAGDAVVHSGSGTLTVTGDVTGGSINAADGITLSGVGATLVVNGSVFGGTTPATTAYGINVTGAAASLTVGGSGKTVEAGTTGAIIIGQALQNFTVNADVLGSATTAVFGITCTSGASGALVAAINGDVIGRAGGAINLGSTIGIWTITGDGTGGTGAAAVGITCASTAIGTINVTGNVTGGSNSTTHGINASSAQPCVINVVGNVTGGSSTGQGISVAGVGNTLTVTGTVTGGTASTSCGILQSATSTVTINGDCVGGTLAVNYGYGITAASALNCNVWGTARPGTGLAPGVHVGNTEDAFVQTVQANNYPNDGLSTAVPGVTGTSAVGAITCDAMIDGTGGYQPIQTIRAFYRGAGTNYVQGRQSNAGSIITLGEATDYPAPANVRAGTAYNFGTLTGTLAVPPAGSVAKGVPVDNATGTAELNATALLGADLKARLEQCSTVATTGAQIAALG
jgi:hypothetical protein